LATHKRGGGRARSQRKDAHKRTFNELVDKRVQTLRGVSYSLLLRLYFETYRARVTA